MFDFEYIAKHLIERIKEDDIPTAFMETTYTIDETEKYACISSYGKDLSKDFVKYIGDGIVWVKYRAEDNGILEVTFNCGYDTDMTKYSKNTDLVKIICGSNTRIDIDDILKMMSIEIHNVGDNFDSSFADILTAAAVLIMN